MNPQRRPRPLFLFYVLVTYILIQFGWWAWLMIDLNQEIYALKAEVATLKGDVATAQEIVKQAPGRRWMVIGEGIVFLMILTLGILQIRRTHKKEHKLALQQQNFLMSVTHELKSPIASVKLWLQTLQRRNLGDDKRKEILNKSLKDTDRLHHLVDNILIAARIENSATILHKETINLSQIITDFLQSASETIGKNHPTQLDVHPHIMIEGDINAINSIIANLYENAIKYSPEGSTVEVSLSAKDGTAVLKVKDQGIGLSTDERSRIFEKFYRVGNEDTRTTKGTGLGLFIVAQLTQLLEGSIHVAPNPPKGTVFEVHLKQKTIP